MQKKEILNHLAYGIEKQVPDVWDEIKHKVHNVKDNENITNTICTNIYFMETKRNCSARMSIAAVACIIIIAILAFTPALAYIEAEIWKIHANLYNDIGIKNAINKGVGQIINKSYTDNGITVRVDRIISDDNRTAILLAIESDIEKLKDATIDSIEITNQNDEIICDGGIMRHTYDNKKNIRRIVYYINSLNNYIGHDINLKINKININSYEPIDVDTGIKLGNNNIVNASIDLKDKIPSLKSFIIKNYERDKDIARIDFEYKIEENSINHMVFFKLYYGTDQEVQVINNQIVPYEYVDESSNIKQKEEKIATYRFTAEYKVDSRNFTSDDVRVIAQYYNNSNYSSKNGNWVFNFRLQKNLVENSILKTKVNKKFSFNNNIYIIKYAVFSPSETRVYIQTADTVPIIDTKDIVLKNDKEILRCIQYFKDSDGFQVYSFSPTEEYENVIFQIAEIVYVPLSK